MTGPTNQLTNKLTNGLKNIGRPTSSGDQKDTDIFNIPYLYNISPGIRIRAEGRYAKLKLSENAVFAQD